MGNEIKSALRIRGIELLVNLGWEEEERKQRQTITVDIDVQFIKPPAACTTDNLQDTFCYAALTDLLRKKIASKAFKLIEHLVADIYAVTKTQINNAKIMVMLTKHPEVYGLVGGVTVSYGDS